MTFDSFSRAVRPAGGSGSGTAGSGSCARGEWMVQIIRGIGDSHTTLMNTQWAEGDHLPREHAFRNALGTARTLLAEAKPDVVVILGSNHFRGFWLDLMPAFTIGVGDIQSAGEHGTPAGTLPSDGPFALDLCRSLIDAGIDIAFSDRIAIDPGISHALPWVIGEAPPIPIVPTVVKRFTPPPPRPNRVSAVGPDRK